MQNIDIFRYEIKSCYISLRFLLKYNFPMEHQVLINSLKKALKLKGITYPKLAEMLEISEGSVGRIFSEGTFTLERFVRICNLIGFSLEDLILLESSELSEMQFEYTLEQEIFFAQSKNKNYLVFFEFLLDGKLPHEIAKENELDDNMLVKLLSQLEKLHLIEWLPGNKAKILTSRMIAYKKDGPLTRAYAKESMDRFLDHNFDGENEIFFTSIVQFSQDHQKKVILKIEEMAKDIKKEMKITEALKMETNPCGLVLALRPWSNPDFMTFNKSLLK